MLATKVTNHMNVTISGASGFVGNNLSSFLQKQELTIHKMSRADLYEPRAEFFQLDSAIIHLAGMAHHLTNSPDPQAYFDVNFELTKKLYDAFLKSDAKMFIFISSVKAVADSVVGSLDESMIPSPLTDYGKSKLMAEQYIQSQPLPDGKSYFILRPCMIHGPGNKGNLNLLYQVVKKGIPYPLAAFKNERSFLSVENLCFVIGEMISRTDIPSGIYNVSDSKSLSTSEVVTILSDSLGRKARLWNIPPSLIQTIAKLGDKLRLPLTTERLGKLTESFVVSNTKLMSALDKPLPLTAEAGLAITAESFKNS